MSGNKRSGNRNPRKKASAAVKSKQVLIRLNPRFDGHKWALDYIDQFQAVEAARPENERMTLGDLLVEAFRARENMERIEPRVIASAEDVANTYSIVQYIMDKLENGSFAMDTGKKRQKREKAPPLSEGMQATVDRYIGKGFIGSEDVDED